MSVQLPSRQIGRAGDLSLTQKQLHQMKKALDLQKFEVLQLHRKTISHFLHRQPLYLWATMKSK